MQHPKLTTPRLPRKDRGFTIIELLIVIVVIAILVAILILLWLGVTKRAHEASLRSDLRNGADSLAIYKATADSYPGSGSDTNDGRGFKVSPGNELQYTRNSPDDYCLTGTSVFKDAGPYYVRNGGLIQEGACPGHSTTPPGGGSGGSGGDGSGSGGGPTTYTNLLCNGTDTGGTTTLERRTSEVLTHARAYATNKGTTLRALTNETNHFSQDDAAALAATLSGWSAGVINPEDPENDGYVLDPDGNRYRVINIAELGGTDPDIVGVISWAADDSYQAITAILDTTGQCLFPSIGVNLPLDLEDTNSVMHILLLFVSVEGTEWVYNHGGYADVTGADLLTGTQDITGGPDGGLLQIISGPAGGPWVFAVAENDMVPESYWGCRFGFSPTGDNIHIKFDGTTCHE
ncbi:MAG: prepilin-type N-terminal cleavage/methylation domain-containing protein [Nocardioidaceae bacterium]